MRIDPITPSNVAVNRVFIGNLDAQVVCTKITIDIFVQSYRFVFVDMLRVHRLLIYLHTTLQPVNSLRSALPHCASKYISLCKQAVFVEVVRGALTQILYIGYSSEDFR